MVSRTPTSPRLIRCPFCDHGRYSPEYLPRHIELNHPMPKITLEIHTRRPNS